MESELVHSTTMHNHDRPDYWNESVFCRNRLPPRAYFLPAHHQSLSGRWKFHYASSPLETEPPSDDVDAWSSIDVPGHWQLQGYGHPHYTNFNYPFPTAPPFVPSENPTGIYETHFTVPSDWVILGGFTYRLRFEGVDSAFHVWVDGQEVGYSQGSRNAAEFDITEFVGAGRDRTLKLRVKVYQWSDGSYIEDQDMWWLSGIFRDVLLLAFPKEGHIEDFFVRPELDCDYQDARLDISLQIQLPGAALLEVGLFDAKAQEPIVSKTVVCNPKTKEHKISLDVSNPLKWTAEHPNLYQLHMNLLVLGEKVQTIVQPVGFRKIELKSGNIQVNGRPILFKGVNHHEHHPRFGRAVPVEFLRHDLLTMKRHNINAIRCSHYPQDHRLLTFANELGLYVVDEADLECHGMYVSSENLSDDSAWKAAYLDRMQQLVHRDKNEPCVVMWSLGNESYYGKNHVAMYDWAKAYDTTRLVHYEGDHSGRVSDVYSYMYLTISDLISLATREGHKYKKPVWLQEYGHAMGTGPGGLKEYQEAFHKYGRLQGGFIWEWASMGLLKKIGDESGRSFYAYGGDFGDEPNDGNFVIDGLCDSEHRPGHGLIELKHVFQPLVVTMKGPSTIEIKNLHDFVSLAEIEMRWAISRFSEEEQHINSGINLLPDAEPGSVVTMHLPLDSSKPKLPSNAEIWLRLSFRYRSQSSWAESDHEIAWAQFPLRRHETLSLPHLGSLLDPKLQHKGSLLQLSGPTFAFSFDRIRAKVQEWRYKGQNLIAGHGGPQLTFWRAPTDNDRSRTSGTWKGYGLHRMTHEVRSVKFQVNDLGALEIRVESWIAPPVLAWGFQTSTTYIVHSDGKLLIHVHAVPKGQAPSLVPRVGLEMLLPQDRSFAQWFGLGPGPSYRDMKEAGKIGVWKRSVDDMMVIREMPQENGNRTNTKWVKVVNEEGIGLKAVLYHDEPEQQAKTKTGFDFAVSKYTAQDLDQAQHPHELVGIDSTLFRIDEDHHGLGTGSCGPDPWEQHRLKIRKFEFWVSLEGTGI